MVPGKAELALDWQATMRRSQIIKGKNFRIDKGILIHEFEFYLNHAYTVLAIEDTARIAPSR
jgi:hypothetical protein